MDTVTPDAIRAAHAAIAPHIRRTPLLDVPSPVDGAPPISLKLEFLQCSGSFKGRGAFHNLLTRPAPPVGCATASGGNHGAAVAYAARKLGVKARIFVPETSPRAKVDKVRSYGVEVVVRGADYYEAQALCDAYVAESGALKVHPFEAVPTIAGQGTTAKEWEEDNARLGGAPIDTVLVAVGGAGLIAGVGAWFGGRVKVVGVEPENSRALHAALAAGRPVDVEVNSIAADSLGARRVGELCFAICAKSVAEVALVADDAIRAAQKTLWRDYCLIAEPGGAAAYGALMSGAYRPAKGERVAVLLCGANADLSAFMPLS